MKKSVFALFAFVAMAIFGFDLFGADEQAIVPADVSVNVRYYVKNGSSYSTSGTTLRGATSESMMQNTIAARNPGKIVRIISARPSNSKGVTAQVSYTLTNKNGSISRGSTTLQDVLTESMARNALQVRNPNYTVAITSIIIKKR